MNRAVRYFPILSLFYKPPSLGLLDASGTEPAYEYAEHFESGEIPQSVGESQSPRELTGDELALSERYSNKLRTQIINLQTKDKTNPIGVCVHYDSYTLYLCDVGRSVVEIFDMFGKLQHTIDDPATIKLHPTAIAVAYDGTIIVASHFQHRIHMYSPVDLQDGSDAQNLYEYHFKHYRLGSLGYDLHQFHHPAGITIDFTDGYLYVCDRGNFRIQVMRQEGMCERVIELISNDEEERPIAPIQMAHQQNGDKIICIINQGDALCFFPKYAEG